jgi:hypothetical protein
MYIFELIARAFSKSKSPQPQIQFEEETIEDTEECEHLFMPVDSTNTVFACKYCGFIVSKEQLEAKNFFKQKTNLNFFRKK